LQYSGIEKTKRGERRERRGERGRRKRKSKEEQSNSLWWSNLAGVQQDFTFEGTSPGKSICLAR